MEFQELTERIRKRASIRFIQENGITRDQVEFADDIPWGGQLELFVHTLKKQQHRKPWVEWNGFLNRTQDLIDGQSPGYVASVNDLPE